MNPNPFLLLLHSRKFLLLLLDTVISLVLLFVGVYAPTSVDFIKAIVALLQPVFVALILAIAIEDASLNRQPIIINQDELDTNDGTEG